MPGSAKKTVTIPTACQRLSSPASPREVAAAPVLAARRLEAVQALACRDCRCRCAAAVGVVAVAERAAVAVAAALVRWPRYELIPSQGGIVPALYSQLAGVAHHVPCARDAVGDAEAHVDLAVAGVHAQVDMGADVGHVVDGGPVARPHGAAPEGARPVPHLVEAVGEAPRRRVAGTLP